MARNQFGGTCYRCRKQVEPNTGHFERYGKAWRVQHGLKPGDGRVTCEMAAKAEQPKEGE